MIERTVRARFGYGIAAALGVSALLLAPAARRPEPVPRALPALASWVDRHPADWVAFMSITQQSLESRSKQPVELWRAAYDAGSRVAPYRQPIRSAFVSSGLFHWTELGSSDRGAILENAVPLLAQPNIFIAVAGPLFQLTGDLEFLRLHAPRDPHSIELLESLAASSEKFEEYRQLRAEAARARFRQFSSERSSREPSELLALLPATIHLEDEPLLRGVLEELHTRPIDRDPERPGLIDSVIDFAIRHDVQPLDGIEVVVGVARSASDPSRARLALSLGNRDAAARIEATSLVLRHAAWTAYYLERAEFERTHGNAEVAALYAAKAAASRDQAVSWQGLCSPNEICTGASAEIVSVEPARTGSLVIEPVSASAAPYVEIYVDDERIADDEISSTRNFGFELAKPAVHSIQIRIVDPFTHDGRQRTLRVVRLIP